MLRIHIKHLCHADTVPGTEDTGDKAGKSKVGVGENSSQREGPVEQRCRNGGAWRLSSAFTQSPHLVGGGGRGRGEVMSSRGRQGEEAEKGAEEGEGEREGWARGRG